MGLNCDRISSGGQLAHGVRTLSIGSCRSQQALGHVARSDRGIGDQVASRIFYRNAQIARGRSALSPCHSRQKYR